MDTHVVIDHLGTTRGRGAAAAVPLDEAAWALGLSRATVRRGRRCAGPTPPPPDTPAAAPAAELVAAQEAVRRLEAHCADLRRQLEGRTREAAQLHALLAQAHQLALPSGEEPPSAPRAGGQTGRSWWQRLWGG
jgi:hypothetical protein